MTAPVLPNDSADSSASKSPVLVDARRMLLKVVLP